MDIMKYIVEKAIVLIPALWILGSFLKNTPNIPDWTIPWALLVIGIIGSGFILGWTPDGIVQGILVTGAAILGNQLMKQTINKN
ncbi:MAG: phage holin family protein [Clostridia bacterium]|nr:phage holin family protein [Clostridia bacterium]